MQVFLITSTNESQPLPLSEVVAKVFEESERRKITQDTWLVSSKGLQTTSEVFDLLRKRLRQDTSSDKSPFAFVVPAGSYYGFGDVAHWQWIQSKIAATRSRALRLPRLLGGRETQF